MHFNCHVSSAANGWAILVHLKVTSLHHLLMGSSRPQTISGASFHLCLMDEHRKHLIDYNFKEGKGQSSFIVSLVSEPHTRPLCYLWKYTRTHRTHVVWSECERAPIRPSLYLLRWECQQWWGASRHPRTLGIAQLAELETPAPESRSPLLCLAIVSWVGQPARNLEGKFCAWCGSPHTHPKCRGRDGVRINDGCSAF